MVHKNTRPTVHDIRAMKARGQKISMLYVTSLDEAAAANAAGIDMLSIEGRFFSPEMREAAGNCFVQVGLPFGPYGGLTTAEDYLRAAYHFTAMGGDCFYCAASLDIQKVLCDNHVPIVAHVGLIPSYITWTGWRAVGKTATEARAVWDHVKQLEAIGCFGAELEVVPDRLGTFISQNTSMIMLGMGVVFYFLPRVMIALGDVSPWLAGVFGALLVLAFFLLFWLRARYQRNREG